MIRKAWMLTILLVSLATIRLTAQQYGPPAIGNTSAVLFAPATLNLVAGLNGAGYGGDGGPANSATTMLSYPIGIAYDANGNLFIADEANHVVRRIDHGTGYISTFAGQEANPGFSIGGGVATNAQMQGPSGLVVDSNNNVYVADRFNNVVFEITPAGAISIFAGSGTAGYGGDGGPATAAAAEFSNPWGLGIDANNNIYVADTGNNLIREVTQAGNLSTFAGDVADVSGCNVNEYSTAAPPYTALQAHLCSPQGIAFDSLGNAYISDTKNDIIRKVDNSGNLTQFAGTFKTPGFAGDGGPATSAWFNLPAGLYADPAGRVYISDFFNERIRVVDTLGNINTVFGTGFGSLNANAIGTPDTEAVSVSYGPANGIYNFVLDQDGNIIATDSSSNAVTSAGSTGQYVFPEQFVFSPSAAKYVTVENPSGVPLDFLGTPTLTGPYTLATGASAGTCNFSGTLAPGGTCTIGVIFTPIVDDAKNPGSLTLTTNANSSPSTINFTGMSDGTGITSASLTGPVQSFSSPVGQTSAAEQSTLTNTGQEPIAVTSVAFGGADPKDFAVSSTTCPASPATLASGASCVYNITFTPTKMSTETASFQVNIANYGQLSYPINGVGTAATPTSPQVMVAPSPASITTAQALTVTVTVGGTPTPTGSVTLTSGSYSSGAVTLSGGSATINVPAGSLAAGTDTLTASYTPDSASAAVYTSATGTTRETVTQAVAEPITASPVNGNFGTVPVGSTSSVVSVTLTIPSAVTLSNIAALTQGVANLDFAIQASGTTCVAGAQAAGSSCMVALTFSPLYPGPRFGALVLYDNSSPANAVATVYLTGIGQGPLFAIVPGVMTTVAGNGTAASSGDNGQATSASLVPVNMALDSAGDIFVQDSSSTSALIRRIDGTSGVITTIAGGGGGCANQTDSLGDGCKATQASFGVDTTPGEGASSQYDNRLVLDGAGNLYTTDLLPSASAPSGYTWIIRKIDAATGVVSNVTPSSSSIPLCTGGGGLTPTVSNGTCFLEIAAVDGNGAVYLVQIESNDNTSLLTLSPQSSALTSVVSSDQNPCIGTVVCLGGGSIDGQGNLYLSDNNGNVRKVIPSTGASTAWTGPSLACDDGYVDPVLRVDAAGDGYFAPGSIGSLNQEVVCEAGATAQAAVYYAGTDNYPWAFNGDNIPATQANLNNIGDIELDGLGNLYISDNGNNRIRKDTVGTGTPIVFPSTAEGATSAPIDVTIQNIGNAALSFSSIVVSPQFSISSSGTTCAAQGQIAPGTTCVLAIAFAPTTTGPVTGTITFGDNSLNTSSTSQILLSGTATGAALAATTTMLQTSASSVTSGSSVTLTAMVAETSGTAIPTGTVTFYDGTNSIGTGTLNSSGVATLSTSSLALGANSITAQYGGDSNNAASTSGAVSVTVTAPAAPVASLTPAAVVFSSTTVGSSSAATATLSNTGNAALTISGISITGANPSDFAETSTCGSSLAAGSSCTISVIFTPASATTFAATLSVADNAAGSPQTAMLSGTGTAPAAPIASLTPATVPFGSLTVGTTSAPMSLTLSNTGNATLNITGITIAGANGSDFAVSTGANACGATLAAGASCSIYVSFSPASASSFTATVQVADNAAGSPQTSALTGTGTPPPAPVVTLAPTSVAFASQTTGTTSAPTTVTLTNSGNAALTITGISIAGTNPTDFAIATGSNVCGSSVAAGASCNIYVTFSPTSAVSFSASLTIADNAAGSPQTVALTGSGAALADFSVAATPSSQTVQAGGSTTYAVTVSSSGGTFSSPVALTVNGLPTGATGSFSASPVTPGSTGANSTLTVQTAATTTQTARNGAWPLAVPALAAVGLFFIPGKRRRRWISLGMLLLASLGAMTALSGCSGGFKFIEPAQTYTLTITGTSGTDTHSTTVQLTVE